MTLRSMPIKVAIIATHPIQYHIPWFQFLSKQDGYQVKVYYGCIPDAHQQGTDFNLSFQWDIPMFEGYQWEVLENRKTNPGLDGFFSSNIRNMHEVLERGRPDVLILTGWHSFPLLQAMFWSIYLQVPRIVRGESSSLKPRNVLIKLMHRLLLPCYDAYLAIGNVNQEFYEQYGIKKTRIFLCPYFVDNKRFLYQAEQVTNKRDELRSEWGVPRNATCFIYMGKLNRKKRILDLLEALNLAIKINPGMHLLVTGTGELMQEAARIVSNKNLPVTFTGFLNQTEITHAYVAGDCLVLPSDYSETWGLVVNEAMVCGLPAIVSDRVGCGPDLVINGVTGLMYPFGNIKALADHLVTMAIDHETRCKMGKAAKENVLNNYTVERAVQMTLNAILSVIAART